MSKSTGPRTRARDGRARPRRRRYAHLYKESPSFNGKAPFDAWLFEPFYQILRLRLLADRMVRNRELGVSEAKVVVVVPEGKPSVPGAGNVAIARHGVPGPDSLRHRRGDACPPRPRVRIGLTVGLGRLRAKPVRGRLASLGCIPSRPLRMVKGRPGKHASESARWRQVKVRCRRGNSR